jgi:DeoR family transcriptional regulator, aga operon transcriptional repressor
MARRASALPPPQRHGMILRHLQANESASIKDLVKLTGLSESTIRRDLNEISSRSDTIRRFHGGAFSGALGSSMYEPSAALAQELNTDAKKRIALAAADRVQSGQSVLIDSGSTSVEFVRALIDRGTTCTVITNDVFAAHLLGSAAGVKCIVLGGLLRPQTNTLFGSMAEDLLHDVMADVLVLGVHAIDSEAMSESSLEIARVKKKMIGAARRIMLLADSAKFDRRAFAQVAGLDAIHELITDRMPTGSLHDCLTRLQVDITVA